jgi:glycosyltransferase involved in cell wall biosynthesis
MVMGWLRAELSMLSKGALICPKCHNYSMRIIIVHQNPSLYGGPEDICTLKLIRALTDIGVKISLVMRNEPDESLKKIDVDFHPVGGIAPEGVIEKARRVCNLYPEDGWAWGNKASKKIINICSSGEIAAICSRAMPFISHVAAWRVRKQIPLPWIAHFSDPWPPVGYSDGHKYSNLRLMWHRRVVAMADVITFPCERLARYCEEKQWAMSISRAKPKALILPHIAGQFSKISDCNRDSRDEVIFLHCGGFSEERRPDEFILAWSDFIEKNRHKRNILKFRHVGKFSPTLARISEEKGVADTVEQTGPCSYEESLRWMSEASVLLLIDSYKITESVYFPSKLSDYIRANKPILALTPRNGTVADLLGPDYPFIAEPWDLKGIQCSIEHALLSYESGARDWLTNIATLMEHCNSRSVAHKLVNAIEGLPNRANK